jgi:hypothetical protein
VPVGQDGRDHGRGHGEADEVEQREDREAEVGDAPAVQRTDQDPAEEDADEQAEDGAEQGDDDRLPADHRAQLTSGHAEGAQQPDLADSLENGERETIESS